MIASEVVQPGEADEDSFIHEYGAVSYEDNENGSGEAGVGTGVPEAGTKEVHQAVKYSSLSSYVLKPPSLLTQGFKEHNMTQEKLFKDMCNFGLLAERKSGR